MKPQLKATKIFSDFLNDKNEDNLIKELNNLESDVRQKIGTDPKNEKELWFRFFNGDPAATTIDDIKDDLHSPNRKYILEKMEIGVEEKGIQVYFS